MYEKMSEILQEKTVGDFAIEHFEVSEHDLYARLHGIESGEYVKLTQNGNVVMSDTQMEKETNADFVRNAHGDVLIGGLGIGLIVLAIQEKEEVRTITILEKNEEVIELVKNQLPLNEKVQIVNADAFTYKPKMKYNTIYMDIWNYINEDVYQEEMKPLIARYRRSLVSKTDDPNRYIDCWCKLQAKRGERI